MSWGWAIPAAHEWLPPRSGLNAGSLLRGRARDCGAERAHQGPRPAENDPSTDSSPASSADSVPGHGRAGRPYWGISRPAHFLLFGIPGAIVHDHRPRRLAPVPFPLCAARVVPRPAIHALNRRMRVPQDVGQPYRLQRRARVLPRLRGAWRWSVGLRRPGPGTPRGHRRLLVP